MSGMVRPCSDEHLEWLRVHDWETYWSIIASMEMENLFLHTKHTMMMVDAGDAEIFLVSANNLTSSRKPEVLHSPKFQT